MKVTSEQLPDRQVRLNVQVDEDRARQALQVTARRLSRRMRIPGFRPGRAPYNVVLGLVGEDYLRGETFEAIGQELYEEALKVAEIEAFAQGSLEDVSWDPLSFRVTVPLSPIVDLGDYHALRVDREPVLVLDEEIDDALQQMRERHAEWVPVSRAAAYGDMLVLDIRGAVGEEEILSQQNWERVLQEEDSGSLPGFDAALLGREPGAELTFQLTYPDDSSRFAGQVARFEGVLHGVKAKELPPLEDEFAQTVGEHETLDALRDTIRDELRQQREEEQDHEGAVLDALAEHAHIEYPPTALEEELDDLLQDHDRTLQQSGYTLDAFLRVGGRSRDEYRAEQRPHAEQRLKRRLVLRELVEQESITVEPSEVDAEIDRRVARQSEDVSDRVRELFGSEVGRETLRNTLLTQKALQRLLAIASGEPEVAQKAPVPDDGSASLDTAGGEGPEQDTASGRGPAESESA